MHFILFFWTLSLCAAECHFLPPSGWERAQLKTQSPYVKESFVGKGASIHLATEEVDVSLKEYIKAVKELHTADPDTKWRDLGKLQMEAGEGRLIELTQPSAFGEMKILQAIFVGGETAYILTAAALRKDLPKVQAELMKAFKSLTIYEDK